MCRSATLRITSDCSRSPIIGRAAGSPPPARLRRRHASVPLISRDYNVSAGDSEAGKWTVANQLRNTTGKKVFPKKLTGVPLSYTYVAVEDEDGPAGTPPLGRWRVV
jgi:hypothetical protein